MLVFLHRADLHCKQSKEGSAMRGVLRSFYTIILYLVVLVPQVHGAEWEKYVEFRDTVRAGTVPYALGLQNKISVQPWSDADKAMLRKQLDQVYSRAPGLFRLGASQGPIPLYRINLGSSFGGHGSLWFSYIAVGAVAHELTHVADAEHKIARSVDFRNLVEPRIAKTRSVMQQNGYSDYAAADADARKDLYYPVGLPSYYAAATIQETLAEYIRALVLVPDFTPPPEIAGFLQTRLIDASPELDPSVALYRRGKFARLQSDYKTAHSELSKAIELDPSFAEAFIERGLGFKATNQLEKAVSDFTNAIELMSAFDWQLHIPYINRGETLAISGQYEAALLDLLKAKDLAPNASGLDATIAQVSWLADMEKKRKAD
jgi:tetratricopeptide (TPR) repeat protein